MPATVKHVFSNAIADGTNTQIVRPRDWNSNHNITFSAAGSEISGAFSNANGISFGLSGTAVTGSYTVPTVTNSSWTVSDSATSGTVGRLAFTNLNGVTLSLSSGTGGLHTIVGSHNALTTAMQSQSSSVFAKTGFTSTTTAGTAIVGTHNTDGLSIGVPAYITTAMASNASQTFGASNLGNTLGTSGVASGSAVQYVMVATHGMSISQSINGASGTGTIVPAMISQFDPLSYRTMVSNSTLAQNTVYFCPFDVPAPISAYRINFFFSLASTCSSANSTGQGGYTFSAALYTRGTGASTDRISTIWSDSLFFSVTQNSITQIVVGHPWGISAAGGVTQVSSTQSSISNANATTYLNNSVVGFRALPMPISTTLTPGRYWLAVANSTSSANAGVCLINASVMQQTIGNARLSFAPMGTSSTAPYPGPFDGFAPYSAASGAFPATVPMSSAGFLTSPAVQTIPVFNFSAYTTGTGWL